MRSYTSLRYRSSNNNNNNTNNTQLNDLRGLQYDNSNTSNNNNNNVTGPYFAERSLAGNGNSHSFNFAAQQRQVGGIQSHSNPPPPPPPPEIPPEYPHPPVQSRIHRRQMPQPPQHRNSSRLAKRNTYRGKCKWFNLKKRYGFIEMNDGTEDVFVHQSVLKCRGFRSLQEGESLEFEIETDNNGRRKAVNVTGPNGDYCIGQQNNNNFNYSRNRREEDRSLSSRDSKKYPRRDHNLKYTLTKPGVSTHKFKGKRDKENKNTKKFRGFKNRF